VSAALQIVKQAYDAYGRGDIPAILKLVAEKTDWMFVGPASLPYAGVRTTRSEVAEFFKAVGGVDETAVSQPQEFIATGEHVTVLGRRTVTARGSAKSFETDWVHIFTVKDGKITRWRSFSNTAARYGH
jgi:uncharacterized protein